MFIALSSRLRRDEEGAALASVLGISAVGLILSSIIITSLLSGLGFTSSTRAGVQSQAAADAGIAQVRASIMAGRCTLDGGPVFTGTDPVYVAKVYSRSSSAVAWPTTPACPSAIAGEMKIVVEGTAESKGTSGYVTGDAAFVQAEFSAPAAPTTLQTSGPAVYGYSQQQIGGGGNISAPSGPKPTIIVHNGILTCDGGVAVDANVVVGTGDLTITSGCHVRGSVYVSGTLKTNGGVSIGGDVVVGRFEYGSSGDVEGSVWVDNTFTTSGWNGRIKGSLTARTIVQSTFVNVDGLVMATQSAKYDGWYQLSGSLKTPSLINSGQPAAQRFAGSMQTSGTFPAPMKPDVPTVPNWVDFDFDMADWPGFVLETIPTCDGPTVRAALTRIGTNKGVIDVRACSNFSPTGDNVPLNIMNDLVLIGKKFATSNLTLAATAPHTVWFIIPDEVADGLPTCPPGGGTIGMTGGPILSTHLTLMAYAPCGFYTSGVGRKWPGQIYASRVDIPESGGVEYKPSGLPGVNLSDGTTTGSGSVASWQLNVTRNVGSAGPN